MKSHAAVLGATLVLATGVSAVAQGTESPAAVREAGRAATLTDPAVVAAFSGARESMRPPADLTVGAEEAARTSTHRAISLRPGSVTGALVVVEVSTWGLPHAPTTAPDAGTLAATRRAVARGADDARSHLIRAYRRAAAGAPDGCHMRPELLAAIGQVESGNLGGRGIDKAHRATPGVYGPPLTGGQFADIPDTDGGRLDGATRFDRAVGPMQFIPSTWESSGVDGDGDGDADPQNVYDAAASAAGYLCADGRDMADAGGRRAAILSYNQSGEYVRTVIGWQTYFATYGIEAIGQTAGYVPNASSEVADESEDSTTGPKTSPTPRRTSSTKDPKPDRDPQPRSTRPSTTPSDPRPTSTAPGPTSSAPRPTSTGPRPSSSAPSPTSSPRPTSPRPTSPRPTSTPSPSSTCPPVTGTSSAPSPSGCSSASTTSAGARSTSGAGSTSGAAQPQPSATSTAPPR